MSAAEEKNNAKTYLTALRLDYAKSEAIQHTEGPLLIIAGPGFGKTKTLVEKVLYLLVVKDIEPQNILVSTFTEKAAQGLVSFEQGLPRSGRQWE